MRKKYHVTGKGESAICKAEKGNCPLGPHFLTEKEANNYIKQKFSNEFGIMPKIDTVESLEKDFNSIVNKLKNESLTNIEKENLRTNLAEIALKQKGGIYAKDTIVNVISDIGEPDSGATFALNNDGYKVNVPQVGFCASPYPEYSKVYNDISELNMSSILDYMSEIEEKTNVLNEKDTFLGLWNDPSSGKIYLDISKRYETAKEARISCENHDQIAYFDLQTFESVDVDRNATSGQKEK